MTSASASCGGAALIQFISYGVSYSDVGTAQSSRVGFKSIVANGKLSGKSPVVQMLLNKFNRVSSELFGRCHLISDKHLIMNLTRTRG